MQPFDSLGGRFVVGRDRLPLFGMGEVIARSCRDIRDIPGQPASFVEFDELRIEDLSLAQASQKAALHPDTKRWYEGMTTKQVYRFTATSGVRFVYVFCIVDCWRSFLFPDPDPDDMTTRGIPFPGEPVTVEEVQRIRLLTDEAKQEEIEALVAQAVDAAFPTTQVPALRLALRLYYRNPERYQQVPWVASRKEHGEASVLEKEQAEGAPHPDLSPIKPEGEQPC